MQTYWLIGKHGAVGDRQPLEEKQEEMDVMAENPHSEKASLSELLRSSFEVQETHD